MEFDLKPRFGKKIFEGEGGEYYNWSGSDFQLIRESKVGGGRLVLQPRGFALPHYADSSKIGYVLQGNGGIVGMVFPKSSKEEVLNLRAGDIIPVPLGTLSWWFNDGDSPIEIIFMGQTPNSYIPGEFTYFFLTGAQGILGSGFSTELISGALGISEDEANKLSTSQKGVLLTKLEPGQTIPKPHQNDTAMPLVYNIDSAFPDHSVKNVGQWTNVSQAKFPFLGKVGLSASHIKLGSNSMSSPIYSTDCSVQLIYVVKGLGKIQIVGINGKRVLDTEVKAGHLLVVPRFFVVAIMAGEETVECLSVITSAEPMLEDIASKESVLGALSPEVLQASLNVTPEFQELFISKKIKKNSYILPLRN